MWNVPKIVSQSFEPATFRGKVEIGLSSGWNFPNEGMEECRRGGEGGENQRLTSSAWHWLKFVFRQRIKIVPTLSSRRGRYSITHVACQLSNKGQTRKKKEKRGKSKNDGGTSDADAPTRRIYTRCLRERLCSKLFWNLENLNRSDPFFLFSFSHLSIRNRVGTGRTKELLIIRNLRNIYSFLRV